MKQKKRNKKINLKLYRPDANESMMLLEALEKTVTKTLMAVATRSTLRINASNAKQFIQNAYIIVESYTPELIERAVTEIIKSDNTHLKTDELPEAYKNLKERLEAITGDLEEIIGMLTTMYRSVPIHYRVGYMFRDSNAQSTKKQLIAIDDMLKKAITHLQSNYVQ